MDQVRDPKNTETSWVENIALRDAIHKLGERERRIIELRFYEGKTQMEVAAELSISQAQISRIEKGALVSMRNYLQQ
jgi:RNA polymerase sporulation-specific sigma factor